MYPDRATFERMVSEVPDLTVAGRQTLLVLYDGPLRLRQILAAVNARGAESGNARDLTESALRKRLDVLIGRGIVARTGSERINPYYFIRRPWIFSNYILTKCRDGPSDGLLDLTILLHGLSRQDAAAQPHPRFISAFGERTERGHQVAASYEVFRRHLGNSGAIGDYLEGIYADIYEERVPESDIDGELARDFLRTVVVAPEKEHEVRFFFWYAQFFQTLDLYQDALDTFARGLGLAGEQGIDTVPILGQMSVSKGSILLHLDDLAGAKAAFLDEYPSRCAGPLHKARCLLGAGEAELIAGGDRNLHSASGRFALARNLCHDADPGGGDTDARELDADILRATGTIHRLEGRYAEAAEAYERAGGIYREGNMYRGLALLLVDQGELARAGAFMTPPGAAPPSTTAAFRLYEEAKNTAQRIRTIRGYANALVGECELARIAYQRFKVPLPRELETTYDNAFEIYCQINSRWGIVQTFISEALMYHAASDRFPEKYADTADKLEQAGRLAAELGLVSEQDVIRRIRNHADPAAELNPLRFF